MTGEHKSGTGDALGKSPVYSPLGSSAHDVGHSYMYMMLHAMLSYQLSCTIPPWLPVVWERARNAGRQD